MTEAKACIDALFIQVGACNPSGVARSIVAMCDAARDGWGDPAVGAQGTDCVRQHPAVRLAVHQLAFLCGVGGVLSVADYDTLMNYCKTKAGAELPECLR